MHGRLTGGHLASDRLFVAGEGKGGKEGNAVLGQVKRGDKGMGYLLPEIIVDSIILDQILAFRVLTSQSNITYILLHACS
jgi:hypothetical protein